LVDKEMLPELLSELLGQFNDIVDWTRGTAEIGITAVQEDYYVDLGVFGEQSLYVEINNDYHEVDVDAVTGNAPHDLEQMRDSLREVVDSMGSETGALDDVLATMSASGNEEEQRLARVMIAVADAVRGFPTTAPVLGPVPPTPAPWPGAMKNIDYTADDFPLRYQPPPGFTWTTDGDNSPVAHTDAGKRNCEKLRRTGPGSGSMVLDWKGRVSWIERGDDTMADNQGRWSLWFNKRDGIPCGTGSFNEATHPLAIDEHGYVIGEWSDSNGRTSVWPTASATAVGKDRVREIRNEYYSGGAESPPAEEAPKEEFAPPEPVAL